MVCFIVNVCLDGVDYDVIKVNLYFIFIVYYFIKYLNL